MHPRSAAAAALRRLPPSWRSVVPVEQRDDLRRALGVFRPDEDGYPREPGPLPPGWNAGPPDLVGFGGTWCGLGWWGRALAAHPHLAAPPVTGARYLSHFATAPFGGTEIERYHRWFPRRAGTVTAEWVPSYLGLDWVPALLDRAAPEARIVVMLRDPLDRIQRALFATRAMTGPHLGSVLAEAVDGSCYGRQLARLHRWISPERILVLQFEACVDDPAGQLDRTWVFCGLDPPGATSPSTPPDRRPPVFGDDVARRLLEVVRPDIESLAGLAPDLDLGRWRGFGG